MSVDFMHPQYVAELAKWQKLRDTIEGEEAVKGAATEYLPMPSGMAPSAIGLATSSASPNASGQFDVSGPIGNPTNDYEVYLGRAEFFEATGRTVQGLVGAVMRKDPTVEGISGGVKSPKLKGITRSGGDFNELARKTLQDAIGVGRLGLLVDAERTSTPENQPRPYATIYDAEAIINWRQEVVGDVRKTVLVVLKEERPTEAEGFEEATEEIWRALRFTVNFLSSGLSEVEKEKLGVTEGGRDEEAVGVDEVLALHSLTLADVTKPIYFQEIWVQKLITVEDEKTKVKEERMTFVLQERVVPRMAGGTLITDEIPWDFVNPMDLRARPSRSVILGLANLNLGHYRNSADLEWGAHLTALPTPWAAGFDLKDGAPLVLGSSVAWVTDQSDASAGFLEFTGAGLGSLVNLMDGKQKRMAVLGARLLEEQPTTEDTATAAELRQSGDKSILATIAETTAEALTRALRRLERWRGAVAEGATDKIQCELNTDLSARDMSPQELTAWVASGQSGLMSWDVIFHNFERREVYPPGWTKDKETRAIAAGLPGDAGLEPGEPDPEPDPDDADPQEPDPNPEDPAAE